MFFEKADAELDAAAPVVIPELLTEVRRLREENARLYAGLKLYADHGNWTRHWIVHNLGQFNDVWTSVEDGWEPAEAALKDGE
jgi:hypothetical protein